MIRTTIRPQLDDENPWPGLESFREEEGSFFFGRDAEAVALLEHVLDDRFEIVEPDSLPYGGSHYGLHGYIALMHQISAVFELAFETHGLYALDETAVLVRIGCDVHRPEHRQVPQAQSRRVARGRPRSRSSQRGISRRHRGATGDARSPPRCIYLTATISPSPCR